MLVRPLSVCLCDPDGVVLCGLVRRYLQSVLCGLKRSLQDFSIFSRLYLTSPLILAQK